jgi:hypothetical protein
VDKRCELSLCGEVWLDVVESVDRRPFVSRARSKEGSLSGVTLLVEPEDDSMLGLSTKLGVWCLGGEEEAVALRISFSVCVRCKRSFRRSLSDCSDDVVVVRRFSLVSRSLTCRSLRSRKALCLSGQMLVLGALKKVSLNLRCSVLCLPTRLCWCQELFVHAI